ncbi:MAG: glycine cleavage system protein GcvH [Chloroflexi bacterium]|jgi:glycine cleavage system H protein|nr:glycine cleavage system protein GcvH [Anaerolineaceae bacterium]NLI45198.1 glycine cleavage system protein GcvH [Chloroflexota bacterium]HOE34725.1 glycine cleavage system protein GcvH [Anaerolineaceae bacterium]HOT25369.1 glycine cleavage system protein GcvH [Anaerolineaceae bacterium]HQH57324.1 glycine cleavage system protein GcvH [Anaerolineaceae bacterium]
MNFPAELKYAQTDEWVRVENGIAIVGISDYAQDALGDVVYFEFSVEAGDQVKAGGQLGQVDSAKASSEVILPVSGVVTEINEAVSDNAEIINNDPYGEAWLVKIKMDNPAELENLLTAEAYQAYRLG